MKKILLLSLLSLIPIFSNALEPQTSTQVSEKKVVINNFAIIEDDINAYVGISDCKLLIENDQNVSGVFTTTFDADSETEQIDNYYYFSQTRNVPTKVDCASGELCTTIAAGNFSTSGTETTINVLVSDLTGLKNADGCDDNTLDKEFFIRMTTKDNVGNISDNDVRIIVDTVRPPAPSGLEASATEGSVNVTFVPDLDFTDVKEFTIYYSAEKLVAGEVAPASAKKSTVDKDETTASIGVELDPNGILYVGIASNDKSDNRSVLSNVVETTVIQTDDFWEVYKGAGGEEEGCASAQGNQSWLLIFFGFIFLSRRRRKNKSKNQKTLVSFITISTLLLFSTNAFAESDIWGSLEIKMGAILPSIDDEFGGSGPYAATFGSESILVGELELDVHLISNPVVLIGAGLHWGYGSVTGSAKAADGTATEDTTSLSIMPLRLSAVARLTYLVTKFNIPFVPSLKLGLDAYRWSVSDPSGETASVDGVNGSGWKPGFHAAAGLHFLLNFLAPQMASNFDFQWGVNRSYLFAEYMITSIDGFGGKGFDFSDNYWNFGLAFDF